MKFAFTIFLSVYLSVGNVFAQKTEVTNLGSSINSIYSELNPIISSDGRTLYFIRSNHPQNFSQTSESQDIWYSVKDKNGDWTPAQHAGKQLNRQQFNTLYNVSPDGNKMLIGGAYSDSVNFEIGYSFIERSGNKWNSPHQLKIKNFEYRIKGDFSSATLSSDNKVLIISFSEQDSSRVNDLYVSFLSDNGAWSEPKILSTPVNTDFDETTPFLSADGITLYFSSNRPGGLGSNDIYMCKRLDDTWRKWSVPVNLGAPVNTPEWDAYFTIPASGEEAYFVSSQNSMGKADIVSVKTNGLLKPKPVVLLRGKVINVKTNKPVEADIRYEILPGGEEAGKADFNAINGDYKIILPYGFHYGISANAKGFLPVSINFDLTSENVYEEINKDLILIPLEAGSVIRLNNIFFTKGKSDLKSESYPELDRIVKIMKEYPSMVIEVGGHTDNNGTEEENLILSNDRSWIVKNYINSKGITIGRISSRGYGEYVPLVNNKTEENRQLNRRVEIKVVKF